MAAYEVMINTINARLKRAKETLKGVTSKPMRKSYEAEIKKLEDRLRKEKAKTSTTSKKNKKSPPKTKEIKTTGTPFGGKTFGGNKFGGKTFGGETFGGYQTETSLKQAKQKEKEQEKEKAAREAAEKSKRKDANWLKKLKAAEKEVDEQDKKRKKAAIDASFDKQERGAFKPKSPKAQSSDTLGMVAKKGKDAREKREAAKRKRDLLSVDPAISKINPMESYSPKKSAASAASDDSKLDPVTKRLEKFFGLNRSAEQIKKDMEETERLSGTSRLKRGGKVKKQSVSTKKYAMNRGGKVASIRKPTRA